MYDGLRELARLQRDFPLLPVIFKTGSVLPPGGVNLQLEIQNVRVAEILERLGKVFVYQEDSNIVLEDTMVRLYGERLVCELTYPEMGDVYRALDWRQAILVELSWKGLEAPDYQSCSGESKEGHGS